jgi:hypothetical protein
MDSIPDAFGWILDDLRAFVSPYPIVAEGWGLRPELVAGVTDKRRMIVLAPTVEWQERQAATVPRAGAVTARVSDPGPAPSAAGSSATAWSPPMPCGAPTTWASG